MVLMWRSCRESSCKEKSCLRYRNNDEHVVRQSDQLTNESSLTHACRAEYTHPGRQAQKVTSSQVET